MLKTNLMWSHQISFKSESDSKNYEVKYGIYIFYSFAFGNWNKPQLYTHRQNNHFYTDFNNSKTINTIKQ